MLKYVTHDNEVISPEIHCAYILSPKMDHWFIWDTKMICNILGCFVINPYELLAIFGPKTNDNRVVLDFMDVANLPKDDFMRSFHIGYMAYFEMDIVRRGVNGGS